jgi:hypothetical protein
VPEQQQEWPAEPVAAGDGTRSPVLKTIRDARIEPGRGPQG